MVERLVEQLAAKASDFIEKEARLEARLAAAAAELAAVREDEVAMARRPEGAAADGVAHDGLAGGSRGQGC